MKYKIFLNWDTSGKFSPLEGEVDIEGLKIQEILEKIFYREQERNDPESPKTKELDIIEIEDGRRFRIWDNMFNELCSKPEDLYCNICSIFYIRREDVPKATHINVRNTFRKGCRNNLCEKCFREYGIK